MMAISFLQTNRGEDCSELTSPNASLSKIINMMMLACVGMMCVGGGVELLALTEKEDIIEKEDNLTT